MIWDLVEQLYGRALEIRARRYADGRARSVRLSRPSISVGNLTLGGTGKTPFVEFLAANLLARGKRPAILSRGYRRRGRDVVVVSSGNGPLVSAEQGGDEPVALSCRLPRAVIVVAARRADAAAAAERIGADLFLLDDGFQHLSVRRDLDLLLLDARDPFGGGRFPPAGSLREPLSALGRADAFVLTRAEAPPAEETLRTLARWNPRAPLFRARIRPSGLFEQGGTRFQPSGRFIAVCGIARPAGFGEALGVLGLAPEETLVFGDHHRYGLDDLARIERAAHRTSSRWIATSEKDAVKLWGRLSTPAAAVRLDVDLPDAGFWPFVESRVGPARSSEVVLGRP